MGYIPKTTKAEVKLFKGLSVQRIVVLIFTGMIANTALSKVVNNVWLQILGVIIALVLAFILSGKSPSNPHKKFLFSQIDYFFYLTAPKKMYGTDTDEYRRFYESEAKKNEKRKKKPKAKA